MRGAAVVITAAGLLLGGLSGDWSVAGGRAGADAMRGPAGAQTADQSERYVGELDPAETVEFALDLRLPGRAELEQFVARLHDPTSADYRRYITPEEVGSRFGLPDASLAELEAALVRDGLAVVERFPQRTMVRVSARADTVEKLFGAGLKLFGDSTGRVYHRPTERPTIPPDLSSFVTATSGLDQGLVHVSSRSMLFGVPLAGLGVSDIELAYEMTALRQAAALGQGETVAIVSFDTFLPADVDALDREMGITGPPVEKVIVSNPVAEPGDGTVEVNLDIDIVRMIAPAAQILNYETSNPGLTNADMVAEVVKQKRAKIVTISWGFCLSRGLSNWARYQYETEVEGEGVVEHEERNLLSATAAGVNVFIASGDSGPYSCRHGDRSHIQIDPDLTASSPNVIAVGGTRLNVRTDGTYLDEVAWEWPMTGEAGGGGQTTSLPRPAWQVGPGVLNAQSNGYRQSPDVSGPGDCASAFHTVWTDPESGERRSRADGCGTSAASPFWAGIAALLQRYARDQGVGSLGYLNPTFYALAAEAQPNAIFHDVLRGANLGHDAGPGWDFATGLGSPRVDPLARAIVEYLRIHPAPVQ